MPKKAAAKAAGVKDAGSAGGNAKLKGAQKVNARHILCEKHSVKEKALEELRNGASFDAVAHRYSEDKQDKGGALGWILRASVIKEFGDVAWELEPSTLKNPIWGEVRTGEGYHIIMVEDRK